MASDYGHTGGSRRKDHPALIAPAGSIDSRRRGAIASESKHVTEAAKAIAQGTAGWVAPTGTASRATFDTASVTTAQLAQRVKALIDDLIANNLLSK